METNTHGFKNWFISKEFSKKKWFFFFILAITLGVIIALIVAGMVFGIRKEKDKNLTYQKALNLVIMPSLFTAVTIIFLIIARIRFSNCFPMELLILSTIILTGIFSTVSTKNAGLVFIGLGIVFLYLGGQVLLPIIWCCLCKLYCKIF